MAFANCLGCLETPATAKRFPARNSATLDGMFGMDVSPFSNEATGE
jgi:hypothetical protein